MSEKDLTAFLLEAIKLKRLKRAGWVKKLNMKDAESVADHSYSLALSSMLFSSMKGLNSEKAVKMALLHDLAEIKTGDLMPEEKKHIQAAKETKAMKELLSKLPKKLQKECLSLWKEFTAQKTREARLVLALDLIEMGLQALDYERRGYDKVKLKEFWKTIEKKIPKEHVKILEALKKMRAD